MYWRLGEFDQDITLFGETPRQQASELLAILEQSPGEADAWYQSGVENTFESLDPYAIIAQRAIATASKNLACTNGLTHGIRHALRGPRREHMSAYFLPAFGTYALQGAWLDEQSDPLAVARITALGHDILPEEEFTDITSDVVETSLRLGKTWSSAGSALLNLVLELPKDSPAATELGELYTQEQHRQEDTVARLIAQDVSNGDVSRFPELVEVLHNPFTDYAIPNPVNRLRLLRSAFQVALTEQRHDLWYTRNGNSHANNGSPYNLRSIFAQANNIVTDELQHYHTTEDIERLHPYIDTDELRGTLEDILYLRCTQPRNEIWYWQYLTQAKSLFGRDSQLVRDILEHNRKIQANITFSHQQNEKPLAE